MNNLILNLPVTEVPVSHNVVCVCVITRESSGAGWLVVLRLRCPAAASTKYLSPGPAGLEFPVLEKVVMLC